MKRKEVIYLALQTVEAKAIIDLLASDQLLTGAKNGAFDRLARIVDAALEDELVRRRHRERGGQPS
ncbi:MAG: hypothetical protein IPK75_12890 [Acidobacteria bacterium]|nr:hypothetical protein [Acidobacteriota bacterium]